MARDIKSISWTIKTDKEGAVTVLSEGVFVVDALNGNDDNSLKALMNGKVSSTYLMLYPVTGRAQLFIEHGYAGETDIPCDVKDFLKIF